MVGDSIKSQVDTLIELPFSSPRPVLALGAELKSTVCVLEGDAATMGPSPGALTDARAYREFHQQVELARRRCGNDCLIIAHDLHPASMALQGVTGWENERIGVQHHHAHVVACMAEHGFTHRVIGICCDGAGYGSDGAVWGGEVLRATLTDFERAGHLEYFRLPGGDAAAKDTWRPALSLARRAYRDDLPDYVRGLFERVDASRFLAVETMLRAEFNCPESSSLGRLFDAVAFLAGYGDHNDTEGQVARRLEQAVVQERVEPYAYSVDEKDRNNRRILWAEMIRAVCSDGAQGTPPELIATRFHETVAEMLSSAAMKAAEADGTDTAVLSGGCFFNRILTERLQQLLRERGFRRVLVHTRLSPGDASLSLGQAVIAAARLEERNLTCV